MSNLGKAAREFLSDSRKALRSQDGPSDKGGLDGRLAAVEDVVKRLERRVTLLESNNASQSTEDTANLQSLLRRAESLIQALVLENQRLRTATPVAKESPTGFRASHSGAPSTHHFKASHSSSGRGEAEDLKRSHNEPGRIGVTTPRAVLSKSSHPERPAEHKVPSPSSARLKVDYPKGYDPLLRRQSISSESFNPEQFKDEPPIVIEKSEEEKEAIRRVIRHNVLFKHLDREQFDEVVSAMSRREVPAGVNVVTQGSSVNENEMFVIHEGECEVYYTNERVAELKPGASFGEIALMYACPRTATIKTKTQCVLWVLDRISFRRILMVESIRRRDLYQTFLSKVPILRGLFPYERAKVADSLEAAYFKPGDVIIRQGEMDADRFFIVEKGEVSVTKSDSSGSNPVFAMSLGPGGYFGELALLRNEPRAATVTAVTDVKCLTISREHFSQVLAPCEEILKRHMTDYKSYKDLIDTVEKTTDEDSDEEDEDDSDDEYPSSRVSMIAYMIESEERYGVTLDQADHAESLKLSKEKIDTIFINLPELVTIHEDMMSALKKIKAEKDPIVAEIFSNFLTRVEAYKNFLKHYSDAQSLLNELYQQSNVASFLQNCESVCGGTLGEYLATIAGRVDEVAAQVKHLITVSPSHHPDISNLSLISKRLLSVRDELEEL